MNSIETQALAPLAKLELKWRKVATRLAAKVMAVHFDSGADDDHVVDEFVIRQALREVLIDLLSTSFISAKEKRYPNSRRRMDLTVGPVNCPIDFAIELKGTGASVEQLAEDWNKMLLFNDATRISILAGIVSTARFNYLTAALGRMNFDLGGGGTVHQIAHDFFRLSSDTLALRPADKITQVSVVYIWHISNDASPLPVVGYHLLPVYS
ncbi:hypothetical protein [Pseudomonas sp. TE3610]